MALWDCVCLAAISGAPRRLDAPLLNSIHSLSPGMRCPIELDTLSARGDLIEFDTLFACRDVTLYRIRYTVTHHPSNLVGLSFLTLGRRQHRP